MLHCLDSYPLLWVICSPDSFSHIPVTLPVLLIIYSIPVPIPYRGPLRRFIYTWEVETCRDTLGTITRDTQGIVFIGTGSRRGRPFWGGCSVLGSRVVLVWYRRD